MKNIHIINYKLLLHKSFSFCQCIFKFHFYIFKIWNYRSKEVRQEYLSFGHFSWALIFFLIHVFRHLYSLTFLGIFVLWNEYCWLRKWYTDCKLFMHYNAFMLWSPTLSFPQADTCDVKSDDMTYWRGLQQTYSLRQMDRFL